MNLHHPSWDLIHPRDPGATQLLNLAARWKLQLLTPPGTTTRSGKNDRDSTIDLIWTTDDIRSEWIGIPPGLRGSDHLPQEVLIRSPRLVTRNDDLLLNWSLLDVDQAAIDALDLPAPGRLDTTEQIDAYLDRLVGALLRIGRSCAPPHHGGLPRNRWWNTSVQKTVREAAEAERMWRIFRSEYLYERMLQMRRDKAAAVNSASQEAWRRATHSGPNLWKLARWARLESFKPREPTKIPALKLNPASSSDRRTARTVAEKEQLFRSRFYPTSTADISDITDTSFSNESCTGETVIPNTVTPDDILYCLAKTATSSSPGNDTIPNRLLKACGYRLAEVYAPLVEACLQLSYFPSRFRVARTVVIPKAGKPPDEASSWRPIALLNTLGKIIESLLAQRLARASEDFGLLPDEQMGNRQSRSTESALYFLADQVHTAWAEGGIASLLALDISGAFDTVSHTRLLDVLRSKGFPGWLVRLIRSFLESRTTTLCFDDQETVARETPAGVPQGSPLSPILFILYTSSLYDALRQVPGITTCGFADDTKILGFGRSTQETTARLQQGHQVCIDWARRFGIKFAPAKYKVLHFSRGRSWDRTPLRLGNGVIIPAVCEVKLLGVVFDRKLNWKGHHISLQKKLSTQRLALDRIVASTWGPTLRRARTLYTAVIRSSIGHGAAVWHPAPSIKRPTTKHALALGKLQNQCLKRVLGAFKATPTRQRETEAEVPPLDLWLSARVASFQSRLEASGLAEKLRLASDSVRRYLRQRPIRSRRTGDSHNPQPRPPTKFEGRQAAFLTWMNRQSPKAALLTTWKERWELEQAAAHRRSRNVTRTDLAASVPPGTKTLRLHDGLHKAESSLLVQLRTGKIGLKHFLLQARVPEILTDTCECGQARETASHLAVFCPLLRTQRARLVSALQGPIDFLGSISQSKKTKTIVRWFMRIGRLEMYRLAIRLIDKWEIEEEEGELIG